MTFEQLPFVTVAATGKVIDTWSVTPTGDYSSDCQTGRRFFRSLLMVMQVSRNSTLLSRVLEGQARQLDKWSGIEAGFHQAMGEELMVD